MQHGQKSHRNVVPLWHRTPGRADARLARLAQIWASYRHGKTVPLRSALQPRDLGSLLSNAFLLEQVRPGSVRFRLAGQHLAQIMGMDVRGMPLRSFMEIPDRNRLMENVNSVFSMPARLNLDLVSDAQGQAVLSGRMVILPLRGQDGAIDRAIGALETEGLIGLTPRRFRIRHVALSALDGRPVPTPMSPTGSDRPALSGSAPRLRVVQGGRA